MLASLGHRLRQNLQPLTLAFSIKTVPEELIEIKKSTINTELYAF